MTQHKPTHHKQNIEQIPQKTEKYQPTPYTKRKNKQTKQQDQQIKNTITKTPNTTHLEPVNIKFITMKI